MAAQRREAVQAVSFQTEARPPADRSAREERLAAGSSRAGLYRLARLDGAASVQVGWVPVVLLRAESLRAGAALLRAAGQPVVLGQAGQAER